MRLRGVENVAVVEPTHTLQERSLVVRASPSMLRQMIAISTPEVLGVYCALSTSDSNAGRLWVTEVGVCIGP